MEGILNIALRVARDAGRVVRQRQSQVPNTKQAAYRRREFVERLRLHAARTITETVQRSFPDHAVLDADTQLSKEPSEYSWFVDPLHGEGNFMRRINFYCVVIAIFHKRVLNYVVIVDPQRDEEFIATKDNGIRQEKHRLRVSVHPDPKQALTSVRDADGELYTLLASSGCEMRESGCLGLDLAYLAAERVDAVATPRIGALYSAIAQLVVREAGGFATSLTGGEWLAPHDGMVAANPQLHRKLVALLRTLA